MSRKGSVSQSDTSKETLASVSSLLQKIQSLRDNDDVERNKAAELLTVLAGSVKALQSNQVEFNTSSNVLVDLFLKIHSCSPCLRPLEVGGEQAEDTSVTLKGHGQARSILSAQAGEASGDDWRVKEPWFK